MTPKLRDILIGAVAVIILFGAIALGLDHYKKKETIGETISHIEQGAADAHVAQAQASDPKVADLETKLLAQKKDLDRLKAERLAMLAHLATLSASSPNSANQGTGAGVVGDDVGALQAVVEKDAEVIKAQDDQIGQQAEVITQLTVSRDQWKGAYDSEHKALVGLQIALDAQKVVSKMDKWIYRGQGFALGFAGRWAYGRLR